MDFFLKKVKKKKKSIGRTNLDCRLVLSWPRLECDVFLCSRPRHHLYGSFYYTILSVILDLHLKVNVFIIFFKCYFYSEIYVKNSSWQTTFAKRRIRRSRLYQGLNKEMREFRFRLWIFNGRALKHSQPVLVSFFFARGALSRRFISQL